MPSSPEEMAKSMIANMPEKTGKTIDEWVAIARKSGFEKHGQITKYLKTEHGMTHGYASMVAHTVRQRTSAHADSEGALVHAQYAGAKADLRAIYDALVKAVTKFGKDVELSPKKAYVSLRRKTQFGLVQPSTKTRVDIGLKLKGRAAEGRLEDAGKWNQMVTHRVRVTDTAEVDKELIGWLRAAYDGAG